MTGAVPGAPSISVVIPARDAAGTLGAQLDAVLAQQSGVPFEVIVVDDGSTDRTPQLVNEYSARDARVRPLRTATPGAGPSAARNIGVRAASGEVVLCCDADDIVGDGWVEAMAGTLVHEAFVAGVLEVDQLNDPTIVAARGTSIPGRAAELGGVMFAHGCNLGIRRSVFLDIGGLDETLRAGEEIDLAIRLRSRGIRATEVPDAVVHYRYRDTPRAQWRQAFAGGVVKPHLCRQLRRNDLAAPRRLAGLRGWLWLLRGIPRLGDPVRRARWQWVLASRCGQIAGCVKYRTLYL